MQLLKARPTISEEEKQQYTVVDDQLLVALETNLRAKEASIDTLQQGIATQEQKVNELNTQKGAADEYNNTLAKQSQQLADAQSQLATLKSKFDLRHWEKVLASLVKLQEILPQYEAYHTAQAELSSNEAAIKSLQQAIAKNSVQEAHLLATKEQVERENTPKISVLEGALQRLEAALALYPKLQAAAEALGKSQRALVDAEAKMLADKAAYEQALADKEAYENNLAALGNAQA